MKLLALLLSLAAAQAQVGRFPHIEADVGNRQVRVECQVIGCLAPLEFFCVLAGTNEHEAVLRTRARPSHIHAALLMLGLQSGQPVTYSESTRTWSPPQGPPLNIRVEFTREGQTISLPANSLMRHVRTRQPMPPTTWVFTGSRIMPDGVYAADVTGYVVSIVNFDLTVIDVPQLASSANETLQWEADPDALPPPGQMVTMIIEPADEKTSATAPASQPADKSLTRE